MIGLDTNVLALLDDRKFARPVKRLGLLPR